MTRITRDPLFYTFPVTYISPVAPCTFLISFSPVPFSKHTLCFFPTPPPLLRTSLCLCLHLFHYRSRLYSVHRPNCHPSAFHYVVRNLFIPWQLYTFITLDSHAVLSFSLSLYHSFSAFSHFLRLNDYIFHCIYLPLSL